jgi:hypothetical protein
MTRPLSAGIALAASFLAGCAIDPAVNHTGARRVETTDQATEVEVLLVLDNPNDAPLELITWEYSLQIDGRTAYSGTWMASLTLPPQVPMPTELPAVIPAAFGDISNAQWRIEGSFAYRATRQIDRLLYQLGITRLHGTFSASGTGFAEPPARPAPKPGGAAQPAPPAPAPPAPQPPVK